MYAKLFTSIYQGTLRGDSAGLLVFTNLLAHCDQMGVVDIHPRAISEEIGLDVEAVKAALLRLEAPDAESRSPEEDGRRIVRVDDHRAWGWRVVNYCKYRAIRNEDDRREQNRLAQERWRNKNKQSKPPSAADKPDKPIQKQRQKEITKEQSAQHAETERALVEIRKTFKKAGHDPRLMALLNQGATPHQLGEIAAEAAAKGRSWAWMLKACEGRLADAAEVRLPTVPAKESTADYVARMQREAQLERAHVGKPAPDVAQRLKALAGSSVRRAG